MYKTFKLIKQLVNLQVGTFTFVYSAYQRPVNLFVLVGFKMNNRYLEKVKQIKVIKT